MQKKNGEIWTVFFCVWNWNRDRREKKAIHRSGNKYQLICTFKCGGQPRCLLQVLQSVSWQANCFPLNVSFSTICLSYQFVACRFYRFEVKAAGRKKKACVVSKWLSFASNSILRPALPSSRKCGSSSNSGWIRMASENCGTECSH